MIITSTGGGIKELPSVTTADNGSIMVVENGVWVMKPTREIATISSYSSSTLTAYTWVTFYTLTLNHTWNYAYVSGNCQNAGSRTGDTATMGPSWISISTTLTTQIDSDSSRSASCQVSFDGQNISFAGYVSFPSNWKQHFNLSNWTITAADSQS